MAVRLESPALTKDIVFAQIPAFPPVILRAIDLLAHEDTDTVLLVREIASDATLSAQLLRLANSALFGMTAQVETVHHAIVTLGFVRVQALVLSVATTNYMRSAIRTEALHKCWRHTLATAVLSRELASAVGLHPDRAYSLGLLHDLGRLGLLVAYPEDYERVFQAADRDAVSLLDLEKRRFGVDHCEAGRQLVEQWKLPHEFQIIAGRHHDSPSGGSPDLLTVIHTACRLADTFGYSVVAPLKQASVDEICSFLPASARERFTNDPDVLAEILENAIDPDHSFSHTPLVDRIAALPPRTTAISALEPNSTGGEKEQDLFATVGVNPRAWELPILFFVAVVVLAGLGVICYLSIGQ